jgi:hypothetical protein
MWNGAPEEYCRLYDVTAKHLKKRFPGIKVGGYALATFAFIHYPRGKDRGADHLRDFFEGFFAYIREHRSPIDFFSWHCYYPTKKVAEFDRALHERLVELGYGELEVHLNEWDPFPEEFGTGHHGAEVAATMIAMQNGYTDKLFIYDMRKSNAPYCPLFHSVSHKPLQAYYVFVAFNKLYELGTQVKLTCDTEELYALAASHNGKHAILLSNLTDKEQPLTIEGVDLSGARFHVIDNERLLSWAPSANSIPKNAVLLIETQA